MSGRVGKPMDFVYVMARADGAHKIGVTGDVDARRATLSRMTPATLKPLCIVASYNLGTLAPLIEKVAHAEMAAAGYRPEAYEWFLAPRRECTDAVDRAVRLIEEIGPDGWRRRRVRTWMKKNSRKLKTWADVAKKLPKGVTTRDCWNEWGARNSDKDEQS